MADLGAYPPPRREGDHRFVTRQEIERAQPFDLACIVGKYLARMDAFPEAYVDENVPQETTRLINELCHILNAIESREPGAERALATLINSVQALVDRLTNPERNIFFTSYAVEQIPQLARQAAKFSREPLGEIIHRVAPACPIT